MSKLGTLAQHDTPFHKPLVVQINTFVVAPRPISGPFKLCHGLIRKYGSEGQHKYQQMQTHDRSPVAFLVDRGDHVDHGSDGQAVTASNLPPFLHCAALATMACFSNTKPAIL